MKTKLLRTRGILSILVTSLVGSTLHCGAQAVSSIESSFNSTSIAGTSSIWFNAHLTSVSFSDEAASASEVVLQVRNSRATFTSNGVDYSVQLPDTDITFSNATYSATGSFDEGKWTVTSPMSGSGDPFLGGMMWDVPEGGISGGANPVIWTAEFATIGGTISELKWEWSAAVYGQGTNDPNALGVLWEDGESQSGTPMNFVSVVMGGARGEGGSNYTGSNSATGSATEVGPQVWSEEASVAIPAPTGKLLISHDVLIRGVAMPIGYEITRAGDVPVYSGTPN